MLCVSLMMLLNHVNLAEPINAVSKSEAIPKLAEQNAVCHELIILDIIVYSKVVLQIEPRVLLYRLSCLVL